MKHDKIVFESTQGRELCDRCNGNLYATRRGHNEWLMMCPKCLCFYPPAPSVSHKIMDYNTRYDVEHQGNLQDFGRYIHDNTPHI